MGDDVSAWYNNSDGSSSDYAWLPGHWLSEQEPPGEGRASSTCIIRF
jgi:hypothetical protein